MGFFSEPAIFIWYKISFEASNPSDGGLLAAVKSLVGIGMPVSVSNDVLSGQFIADSDITLTMVAGADAGIFDIAIKNLPKETFDTLKKAKDDADTAETAAKQSIEDNQKDSSKPLKPFQPLLVKIYLGYFENLPRFIKPDPVMVGAVKTLKNEFDAPSGLMKTTISGQELTGYKLLNTAPVKIGLPNATAEQFLNAVPLPQGVTLAEHKPLTDPLGPFTLTAKNSLDALGQLMKNQSRKPKWPIVIQDRKVLVSDAVGAGGAKDTLSEDRNIVDQKDGPNLDKGAPVSATANVSLALGIAAGATAVAAGVTAAVVGPGATAPGAAVAGAAVGAAAAEALSGGGAAGGSGGKAQSKSITVLGNPSLRVGQIVELDGDTSSNWRIEYLVHKFSCIPATGGSGGGSGSSGGGGGGGGGASSGGGTGGSGSGGGGGGGSGGGGGGAGASAISTGTNGYTCDLIVSNVQAGEVAQLAVGAKGVVHRLLDLAEDAQQKPVDVGDVAEYLPGSKQQHLATLNYGQSAAPGDGGKPGGDGKPEPDESPSPSVTAGIDPTLQLYDKPIASPFAFDKCGLMVPIYPKMRALLAHNQSKTNDAIISGFLWPQKNPTFTPPENLDGDYWLCLPTALTNNLPTGKGANDLTDKSGQRVIQAKGLQIFVGDSKLPDVGKRPTVPDGLNQTIVIEHESGTKISISSSGAISIAGQRRDPNSDQQPGHLADERFRDAETERHIG
jgi:hypothetical protein